MSGEPQRWSFLMSPHGPWSVTPSFPVGKRVNVREDRATEADIEVVAKRLAERDLGAEKIVGPMCEGFKDEARTLLMLVLGQGATGG